MLNQIPSNLQSNTRVFKKHKSHGEALNVANFGEVMNLSLSNYGRI